MTTDAYIPFNMFLPNIYMGERILTWEVARENLVALRDFLVCTGFMPGWNSYISDDQGYYSFPDEIRFYKGTEYIKIVLTWNGTKVSTENGSGLGYPSKAAFYYSSDSEVTYVPLTDKKGNYVMSLTYDSEDNCTATSWGSTP